MALPFGLFFTDTSFKSPEELELEYGIPVVAAIPVVDEDRGEAKSNHSSVDSHLRKRPAGRRFGFRLRAMVSKLMAVYEAYYHCRREPFSLNPDPSFLYASASHREALAQLRYVVQERKGFAVVTGEVGTGKTMLLRSLMETASPKGRERIHL